MRVLRRVTGSLLVLLLWASAARAQESLAARASALRATLGPPSDSLSEDRADFLRRQLLASLERRQDMERALADVRRAGAQAAVPGAPPSGVLAFDDLRRALQQVDLELAWGERRRAVLQQERAATAAQLAQHVAERRTLAEAHADAARLDIATLETELAESATAELDIVLRLVDAQQQQAHARRDALAQRLAEAGPRKAVQVTAADVATLDARLRARATQLRARMSAVVATRERVHQALQALPPGATTAQAALLRERLANADIEMELAREGLTNVATEQAVWQVALDYYRHHDAAALVEAREKGPVLLERVQRRREFLEALSEQTLARSGALSNAIAQAPDAADVADQRALRAVYDQRLQRVQMALYDERQLADLIERLRADFDARVGASGWKERARLGVALVRAWAARAWNFELFTVDQTINVEGRTTTVPRGVTIAKLVKAPLLLLLGLYLAFRLTARAERWLVERRHMEEGGAHLLRRWCLALLITACAFASLALAGIPLAAFAFIGGAVAIGVGFGMQTMFKNLISGVLVLIERPFRLGDVIEIGSLRGTVIDIDLRTSVIRDSDGAETLVPNSALVEENVKNITFRSRVSQQHLEVVVDGDSDPRAVVDALRAAAGRHGQLAEEPEPAVLLDEFADNGLRFVLRYWIDLRPGIDRRRIASDLRLMILGAFEEAGIRMAPPAAATLIGSAGHPSEATRHAGPRHNRP